MKPVLLFVVNDPAFFISHRLPIAVSAQKSGYDVHVATQAGSRVEEIIKQNFKHHELILTRSGRNLFFEARSILQLWLLFWKLRPSVVHLVTIKPVLYGGIAARLSPVKGVLAAVSGLGFVFMARGRKASLIRAIVGFMYRIALGKKNIRVVFQNPDDQSTLASIGAITEAKSTLVRGSGVDLNLFRPSPEEVGASVVTFAARLLRDKGVEEFIHAAYLLKERGIDARFQLVGDPDPGNPTSIHADDISRWQHEGVVECLGYRSDMAMVFKNSHIVVLPSYREGLPKVLLEAAACGRAVVTTDVPGCRDAIDPQVSGLLVPVRDAVALADAIQYLVENPELRHAMGLAGRALAERAFAIESVVSQHLDIYRTLERNA